MNVGLARPDAAMCLSSVGVVLPPEVGSGAQSVPTSSALSHKSLKGCGDTPHAKCAGVCAFRGGRGGIGGGVAFLGQSIWSEIGEGNTEGRMAQGPPLTGPPPSLRFTSFAWCRTLCLAVFLQYNMKFINNKTPEEHGGRPMRLPSGS